jgi:hypothetical protein
MLEELKALGAPSQPAYEQGFPHNNCGKRCVRAGITHFVHLYNVDPAGFLEWEHEEANTMAVLAARGINPLTVLKDRRGGTTKNLTFARLRERILAGDKTLPKDDWGGCGCGVQAA